MYTAAVLVVEPGVGRKKEGGSRRGRRGKGWKGRRGRRKESSDGREDEQEEESPLLITKLIPEQYCDHNIKVNNNAQFHVCHT